MAIGFVILIQTALILYLLVSRAKRTQSTRFWRDHEVLFNSILSATHDIAMLFDEKGTVLDCNRSMLTLVGIDRDEFIGSCIYDRFAEEEAEQRMARINKALEEEKPVRFEDHIVRTDTYFQTTLFPVAASKGEHRRILLMAQDITDRIKSGIALRESEAKFRRLVENVPDVVWTSDAMGNTIYISENVQQVFGFSQEEIYKNPHAWLGRIHPDDVDRVISKYTLLFQNGALFDTEYRIKHRDGHWMWLHDRSMSHYEKDGIPYADGLFTDITHRKKAEEDLAQIFSMSLDLLSISDINSATFLRVNPTFTKTLGYSEEELLEHSYLHFIHPDDVDATRMVIEQQLQMGTNVINFDNRYRCKNGSYRWLSWVAHPRPEEGINIAVARDITEWKENQEALKKSKELLDSTGRMAKVGGWELDADTMEVIWTEETYRIHGVKPEAKPDLEEAINFFHADDRDRLRQAVQRSLDFGDPYDMELRLITADGEQLWTRTVCQPELIDGRIVKLKGTFQDVTDLKNIEMAYRDSEAKLKRAQTESMNLRLEMAHLNRIMTMNELAASFAHELNQPLGAIANNAGVIRMLNTKSGKENVDFEEILSDIAGDAQRAGQIIRKIRGVMTRGEAMYTSLDLNTLLDEVIALYDNTFSLSHVDVFVERDADLPPVKGDQVRLQQVLMNLITNSMEAMVKSSRKILEFKTIQGTGVAIVSISDTGRGIDTSSIEHIFDPFYSTKREGMGIGLRLCKSIIEEHGGRIWAENNPGAGTTFSFSVKEFPGGRNYDIN